MIAQRPSGGETAPRDVRRGPTPSGETPEPPWPLDGLAGAIYLANGARVYVDIGHRPQRKHPGTQ